ncbi:MAG: hypothetical protein ACRCSW_00870 [Tabrizicola sp.]
MAVYFLGDSQFFAVSEQADVWIIVVLAVVASVLQAWSIGLLCNREYDLYMISLTCWLAGSGIRATRPYDTPTIVEQSFVLGLGLLLDAVQIWALLRAVSRAKQNRLRPAQ